MNDDGYYCFDYCEACKIDTILCEVCETVYGRYQYHSKDTCDDALKELNSKQLEFNFK